ncbi:LysR family transcriptional regulator [Sulfuriferula thiophila]|uniref:LysR family transcriptional regulator n=1 Tax=Sulfuriferula thiophila TaxID=1781211 RepID=UPI000F60B604|nr:LysR family transcriptional regulator [Sulfuriferula thiophila]
MRGSEFAELRAFIEVVERGNFSRAASALGQAPSTLSQTIRGLEQRLGVRLLQRTTRSVSLTEAGEHLLARIQPAFETLDAAVESINDFRDMPMGTLRLSVSHLPARMILAPLLKDFLAAYPAINLDISVDNVNIDIVKGRYDAGIRHGSLIAQDMVLVKASAPSRMIAVASPDYLARHARPETPQDLQHHDCICFRRGNQQLLLWEFEKDQNKIEVGVTGPLIVNEVDLMVKAACDGIGIGYMAEAYMSRQIAQGRLIPILTDWSSTYDSWYLYYSSRHHLSAPLKAFIQYLRDSLSTN